MLQRAIRSFRAQTYARKVLYVLNTGEEYAGPRLLEREFLCEGQCDRAATIGALRNQANEMMQTDIIMHWDDDDWSAPNRMIEQVEVLAKAECTGYCDMLFWDESTALFCGAWHFFPPKGKPYVVGTSLAYWRTAWQRNPFPDTSRGEDAVFLRGLKALVPQEVMGENGYPRMVASIHGGNTCSAIVPGHEQWLRVPNWDVTARELMQL